MIKIQTIPEIKELTEKLQKLGTLSTGIGNLYIDVVKNIRSSSYKLTLNITVDIPEIKYEKLLKFLDGL